MSIFKAPQVVEVITGDRPFDQGYAAFSPGGYDQGKYGTSYNDAEWYSGWTQATTDYNKSQADSLQKLKDDYDASNAAYDKAIADRAAAEAKAAEEAKAAAEAAYQGEGRAQADSAYTNYRGAADYATTLVTDNVNRERANAAMRGVEYTITDEQRAARINNQFAGVWSGENQEQFDRLSTEFGLSDEQDFSVVRGTAADAQDQAQAKAKTSSRAKTLSRPTIVTSDEELGVGGSILGG